MGDIKYITCITRMLLNSHSIRGMTRCPGSKVLLWSHCQFCEWYDPDGKPVNTMFDPYVGAGGWGGGSDEIENPVILEKEKAEWF